MAPSVVSIDITSVLAKTCSASFACASSRSSVPARGRHGRGVEATEKDFFVDEGDEFFDLLGRDELGRDAPGLGRGHAAIELLHALGRAGHLNTAALGVHAELDVLTLRVEREERHFLVVIGGEDEVRRVAG
jgi:hypothetical protein